MEYVVFLENRQENVDVVGSTGSTEGPEGKRGRDGDGTPGRSGLWAVLPRETDSGFSLENHGLSKPPRVLASKQTRGATGTQGSDLGGERREEGPTVETRDGI